MSALADRGVEPQGEMSRRDRRVHPTRDGREVELKGKLIIVFNKSDLEQNIKLDDFPPDISKISVSAKTHSGIEELKNLIYDIAVKDKNSFLSSGLNVSVKQLEDLRESFNAVIEARNSFDYDVKADMLNAARINLLRILGVDAGDELLDNMFSRFCVGK